MTPDARLALLLLVTALVAVGCGLWLGVVIGKRRITAELADSRQELARRRAADQRHERELVEVREARRADAAELDALREQLSDVATLRMRVVEVEQQSLVIERLYTRLDELEPEAAQGRELVAMVETVRAKVAARATAEAAAAASAAAEAAAVAATAAADTAAADVRAAPVEVKVAVQRNGGSTRFDDSVDDATMEAANRIANGSARARRPRPDDLKLIEGIGPRIESLCYAAGITTWRALADTPVEQLHRMLEAAGPRFAMHRPDSWPEQAVALASGLRPSSDRLQTAAAGT